MLLLLLALLSLLLDLVEKKKEQYNNVKFVNLSISTLGVFDEALKGFLDMLT